jgi:hypothetical protein
MTSFVQYLKDPLIHLEMNMDKYDITNKRITDSSANGYHATLGDGSTSSTYPTKRRKTGYNASSGQYLSVTGFTSYSTNALTVEGIFGYMTNFSGSSTRRLFGLVSGSTYSFFCEYDNTSPGLIRFYCGGNATNNSASLTNMNGRLPLTRFMHIIGTYDGTNTSLWLNGIKGTNASSAVSPNVGVVGGPLQIFRYASSSTNESEGSCFRFRVWNYALSEAQIGDCFYAFKNLRNRI